MKKLLLFIISTLFFATIFCQTSIVTTTGVSRPVPRVGHMLNYLTKPAWSNQSFIDSVKSLNLEIIRYPGGTESQYFDWETGRSLPASMWANGTLFNFNYFSTTPQVSYPLTELLYFYQQTNVKPIFCLNMLTKTLANQIQMLQTASNLGIPVEYIELGNELYFPETDFVNKYPNPIDYVLDIKNNWIPQLSTLFPNAKIAVIGGYDGLTSLSGNPIPQRMYTWNDTLFVNNVNTEAITFHYYVPPNTTNFSNPNITEALAAPFRHWPTLKLNTVDQVVNGMKCWITEYNLTDGNQTNYSIASTWVHGLYTAAFFSLMLEEPKITMLLNHQIAGSPAFASLASYTPFGDTITNKLTAEGNAMRLIHQALKGNQNATKLNFSLNPQISVNVLNYPSLLGWVFDNGNNKELYVLNLSNNNFTLNLASIMNLFDFEQISASNPLEKNITTQNLIITKGTTSSTLQSVPYSLTYAKSQTVTSVANVNYLNDYSVYPNPSKNLVYVKSRNGNSKINSYQIFDANGRIILSQDCSSVSGQLTIDLSAIKSQLLFIKLMQKDGTYQVVKIVKE